MNIYLTKGHKYEATNKKSDSSGYYITCAKILGNNSS